MKKMSIMALAFLASSIATASPSPLEQIVEQRAPEVKQRDAYRNPTATIEFFKIEPGMSVAEALPGGGWYSQILAPFIGAEGSLHGINYNNDMWARFGFFSEEAIQQQIESTGQFPEKVASFSSPAPKSQGFTFDSVPDSLAGSVDRVLFIRALHNLNRFESEAGTMTNALEATHRLLKADGLVGVVQHRAPEGNSDEWADGSNGYLKQSTLISIFEKAGFKLVASSQINQNNKDLPTETDMVWRLPPTYFGNSESEEQKAAMDAIGESDRMTLLFAKQ